MPRGTTHTIDGLLIPAIPYPVFRVDGGGEWRLDLPRRFASLIGKRARITGTRSDFDMLDVLEAEPL